MVTVTEAAKQELGRALALAEADDPEVGLRLMASTTGQMSLMLDREKEGDQVVEHEGSKVLLVGEELSGTLEGVTIDYQDSPEGRGLVLIKE